MTHSVLQTIGHARQNGTSVRVARNNQTSATRGTYQGLWQIVRFNWTQYAMAMLVVALASASLVIAPLGTSARCCVAIGTGCVLYWTVASLFVSHWVYDRSPLTDWRWLRQLAAPEQKPIGEWLNIHSGFDTASWRLRELFPDGRVHVVDLYDPCQMTEASIRRARRASAGDPATISGRPNALPVPTASIDAVFLLLAAHELRTRRAREELFCEVRRALRPGGRAIVVEHLRDAWNFLAFGPGFLHFYAAREWQRIAERGGLAVVNEGRITPFIGYFVLEKPQ